MKFTEFGLNPQLEEAIDYMGFVDATPIQDQAIPLILNDKDLLACAQTGTGKTAAFVIPMLHLLAERKTTGVRAVIICPTRELAVQIDQQINALSYFVSLDCIAVYGGGGGSDWEDEKKAFVRGADIIVATPGKLLSHLRLGYVDFSNVEFFILDEADRMLDMGFHDDIMQVEKTLPKKRQNLLFSATMPDKIRKLASQLLRPGFEEIKLAISKPAEGILQAAYLVHNHQKNQLLASLIKDKPAYESIIIFSSTKKAVGDIVRALKKINVEVEGISSDYDQSERERILNQFRAKNVRAIVATDVLSRGIDIKDINLVINYDVPRHAEDYVHRVGRTARASTTGVALTFVNPVDMRDFQSIEELIEREIPKLPIPPELGPSPEWDPSKKAHFAAKAEMKSKDRGRGGRSGGRGRQGQGRGRQGGNRHGRNKK